MTMHILSDINYVNLYEMLELFLCSMYQYTAYYGNLNESEYERKASEKSISTALLCSLSLAWQEYCEWAEFLDPQKRIEMGPPVLFP